MTTGAVRVALVGHCGPDAYMLRSMLNRVFPGVTVEMINELLLGSDVEPRTRAMLISDVAESQASAEGAGALPGFGKRGVNSEETRRRLLAAAS
jgi:hypothetical protein